jgi:hypothetical protein
METVIAKLADVDQQKAASDPAFFNTLVGAFKLVPPPHPQDKRFRPEGIVQIRLNSPKDVMVQSQPEPSRTVPIPAKVVEIPRVVAEPEKAQGKTPDDAQVLARIERMMKAEQRSRDLEEENRVLTRTIARLQSEIDRFKEASK